MPITHKHFTDAERALIVQRYCAGEKIADIAAAFQTTAETVRRTARMAGFTRKNGRPIKNRPDVEQARVLAHEQALIWRAATRLKMPRKAALKRDGHRCRVCGWDIVVSVHHIRPKSNGGHHALENLVTLCPNHHAMADRGLVSPEVLEALLK